MKASKGKRGFIDTDENLVIAELLCRYANNEPSFEATGYSLDKGIFLFGNFGSGKTLMLESMLELRRFLGFKVGSKSCRDINKEFQEVDPYTKKKRGYSVIKNFIDKYDKVERMFDDLGEEETTVNDFGNNISVMTIILGDRYKGMKNGVVTHCTSNDSRDEIEAEYGGRLGSRLHSMFNFIGLGTTKDSRDFRKDYEKK